jgi:predicted DNA-binding mobile mystery protein A
LLHGLESQWGALAAARKALAKPARGWLRLVREAVGLTQADVASRMAVKRQSYAQFEVAEEHGAISLASLRRAAEAMDCELVYFVVPRESVAGSFAELAELQDPVAMHQRATDRSRALKGGEPRDDGR